MDKSKYKYTSRQRYFISCVNHIKLRSFLTSRQYSLVIITLLMSYLCVGAAVLQFSVGIEAPYYNASFIHV
jgi:hypothetical protein